MHAMIQNSRSQSLTSNGPGMAMYSLPVALGVCRSSPIRWDRKKCRRTPKEIMSASESSSARKSDADRVSRATNPSNMSKIIAKKMKYPAITK